MKKRTKLLALAALAVVGTTSTVVPSSAAVGPRQYMAADDPAPANPAPAEPAPDKPAPTPGDPPATDPAPVTNDSKEPAKPGEPAQPTQPEKPEG